MPSEWTIVNNELERIWKEAIMTHPTSSPVGFRDYVPGDKVAGA
jgi:hypothetical protein